MYWIILDTSDELSEEDIFGPFPSEDAARKYGREKLSWADWVVTDRDQS